MINLNRDMTHFAQELYKLLSGLHSESFLSTNTKRTVVYPYLTYTFSSEELEPPQEGFYLDLDLFDYGSSYGNLMQLEGLLKSNLARHRFFTDKAHFRFTFNRAGEVRTADENIKRRNMQFYIKIDWRDV